MSRFFHICVGTNVADVETTLLVLLECECTSAVEHTARHAVETVVETCGLGTVLHVQITEECINFAGDNLVDSSHLCAESNLVNILYVVENIIGLVL